MAEQKTFLFVGASSEIATTTAAQLVSAGHLVIGLSTKTDNGPYTRLFTVAEYTPGNFPLIETAIDGLVYFPGTITLKPFGRITEKDLQIDLDVNLLGAFYCVQYYLTNLRAANQASIVFMSSVAASKGFPFHASISVVKSAIEGLTRSLAAELAPNVRVNAIAPGLVNSFMSKKLTSTPEKKAALADRNMLKRIGEPADIASALRFLLSDNSSWITGQVLHVDGGS